MLALKGCDRIKVIASLDRFGSYFKCIFNKEINCVHTNACDAPPLNDERGIFLHYSV